MIERMFTFEVYLLDLYLLNNFHQLLSTVFDEQARIG